MDLRQHGQRGASGPLVVVARPDGRYPSPRVAFAVSKKVGTATRRNLARRRLRSLLLETRRTRPTLLPAGDYLIIGRPGVAERPYRQLETDLQQALERCTSGRPA